jgi:hypothetical protein
MTIERSIHKNNDHEFTFSVINTDNGLQFTVQIKSDVDMNSNNIVRINGDDDTRHIPDTIGINTFKNMYDGRNEDDLTSFYNTIRAHFKPGRFSVFPHDMKDEDKKKAVSMYNTFVKNSIPDASVGGRRPRKKTKTKTTKKRRRRSSRKSRRSS